MQVTFIGTGHAFSRRYGNTNALVEADGIRLMIDFGLMTPGRLEAFGYDLKTISHVVVSHLHADHTGGLEELAFRSKFSFGTRRPTLLLPGTLKTDLWERTLRGGLEWCSDDEGESVECGLQNYFEPLHIGTDWTDIGPLQIKGFKTDHVPGKESWGFIVREIATGYQAIFAGDSRRLQPELLEVSLAKDFASGPIFHDCRMGGPWPSSIHIRMVEIEYPPEVQDRIVCVHYDDDVEEHLEEFKARGLKVAFPGKTFLFPEWRSALT